MKTVLRFGISFRDYNGTGGFGTQPYDGQQRALQGVTAMETGNVIRRPASIFSSILLLVVIASGAGWERLKGPTGADIVGELSSQGRYLIAKTEGYGANVNYYRSSDSGMTWKEIGHLYFRQEGLFQTVIANDSMVLLSSMSGGFRSGDDGKTWVRVVLDSTRQNAGICFESAYNVILAWVYNQNDSALYRSVDKGLTWKKTSVGENASLESFTASQGNMLLYRSRKVIISGDSGITWTGKVLPLEENEWVFTVAFVQNRIVAGTTNGVFFSDDNGDTWIRSDDGLPSGSRVNELLISGNDVYAQIDTLLYHSTDRGTSWKTFPTPGKMELDGMAVDGDRIIGSYRLCTSETGCQCRGAVSIDGGATWKIFPLNSELCGFLPVLVYNNYFFYADGDGVYRSADNGETFVKSSNGIYNLDIFDVEKTGDGLWAGTNRGLFHSAGADTVWKMEWVDSSRYSPFYPVYSIRKSGSNLYAVASGVFRSPDGGSSWQDISMNIGSVAGPAYTPIVTVGEKIYVRWYTKSEADTAWERCDTSSMAYNITDYAICNNAHFISGYNGIFRSTDNGETWSRVRTGAVSSLAAYGSTLFAEYNNNLIVKTSDNGESWKTYSGRVPVVAQTEDCLDPPDSTVGSIAAYGNTIFAAVKTDRFDCRTTNAYVTSDDGATWQSLAEEIPYVVNRFKLIDDNIYASTQYGGIWKLNVADLGIERKSGNGISGKNCNLWKLKTTENGSMHRIILTMTTRDEVSCALYTLSGKRVGTIVDAVLQPGTYSFNLDLTPISHGWYLLAVNVGNVVQMRKLQVMR